MFTWTTGIDLVFFLYDVLVQFGSFRTDVQWYAVVYSTSILMITGHSSGGASSASSPASSGTIRSAIISYTLQQLSVQSPLMALLWIEGFGLWGQDLIVRYRYLFVCGSEY